MFRTALHICEGNTPGEPAAVQRIECQMVEEPSPLREGDEEPPGGKEAVNNSQWEVLVPLQNLTFHALLGSPRGVSLAQAFYLIQFSRFCLTWPKPGGEDQESLPRSPVYFPLCLGLYVGGAGGHGRLFLDYLMGGLCQSQNCSFHLLLWRGGHCCPTCFLLHKAQRYHMQ